MRKTRKNKKENFEMGSDNKQNKEEKEARTIKESLVVVVAVRMKEGEQGLSLL
jgi:hypothetical protein